MHEFCNLKSLLRYGCVQQCLGPEWDELISNQGSIGRRVGTEEDPGVSSSEHVKSALFAKEEHGVVYDSFVGGLCNFETD